MDHALLVYCHPNTTGFNKAIADSLAAGLASRFTLDVIDLYREGFNPVLPYEEVTRKFPFDELALKYNDLVTRAQVLVFVHPDWWGAPPALLKGFIDRIFRPGVAYEFEGNEFLSKTKTELLKGKKAFVFNTTDYKKPEGLYPPAEIWRHNIFAYCGIPDAQVHTFFATYDSTYEERHAWILEAPSKVLGAL